jgi:hypothetical protein
MQSRNETTPEAQKYFKEYESGEKPPRVPRSVRNKSFQSLNYTFFEEPFKKGKEYIGPVSNIAKSCKHTLIKEVLSYASTPPRPVLSSEASEPITYEVSSKGSEFHVLTSYLAQFSRTLTRATKCYNHALILTLAKNESIGFLSNSLNHGKTRVLFFMTFPQVLQQICFNGTGCLETLDIPLVMTRSPGLHESQNSRLEVLALICLVSREHLRKIDQGVYSVTHFSKIVPAYLVRLF